MVRQAWLQRRSSREHSTGQVRPHSVRRRPRPPLREQSSEKHRRSTSTAPRRVEEAGARPQVGLEASATPSQEQEQQQLGLEPEQQLELVQQLGLGLEQWRCAAPPQGATVHCRSAGEPEVQTVAFLPTGRPRPRRRQEARDVLSARAFCDRSEPCRRRLRRRRGRARPASASPVVP